MNQTATSSYKNPENLGQFNFYLQELGFSPITKETLEDIFRTEPRERIVRALNQADKDQRALAYLNNILSTNGSQQNGNSTTQTPSDEPWNQNQRPQQPRSDAPASNPAPPQHNNSASRPSGPYPAPAPAPAQRPSGEGMPQGQGQGDSDKEYLQKHVYGGKGALCFGADETRKGVHTVSLDAAESIGPRQYNWDQKIRIQFTRDELLIVTAVFFGMLKSCKFDSHGEGKDKGFSIEDQGKNLFVRVFAKGAARAVPISPEDAYYVSTILMRQLRKNSPWMSCNDILLTIQRVVAGRKTSQN